ncbi:MAG: hypothetical protein VX938_13145, partial [Myxococcota bacterium]|nr:hypothetical protein [Myxococcota bacterium]
MFRFSLFTITTTLVALTATGCIEGPQMPDGMPPVQTSFATADQAESTEAGPFCDETEAHLNCAIACERLRFCDVSDDLPVPVGFAPDPLSEDPLGECIWTCTASAISGDPETTETAECLMGSGGDCAEVHACVGSVAPTQDPTVDETPVEGSGFDAEAAGEETPECFTDGDCPSDAVCDENGICQHFSQSPVANVMQCESACDALDACGGIDMAGGSFHFCFTQCLAHSADAEVVHTVVCVLNSTSCDEVVGCVEDHQPPTHTFEISPEDEETSTFSDAGEEQEEQEEQGSLETEAGADEDDEFEPSNGNEEDEDTPEFP